MGLVYLQSLNGFCLGLNKLNARRTVSFYTHHRFLLVTIKLHKHNTHQFSFDREGNYFEYAICASRSVTYFILCAAFNTYLLKPLSA